MDDFNRDNPPAGPPSSNQGMTVLKDINEFEDDHDTFMDSLKGVSDGRLTILKSCRRLK
jgi:hypothetical protein